MTTNVNELIEEVAPASSTELAHVLVHLFCRGCGGGGSVAVCGYQLDPSLPEADDDVECVVCIEIASTTFPFCPNCGIDWREDPEERDE